MIPNVGREGDVRIQTDDIMEGRKQYKGKCLGKGKVEEFPYKDPRDKKQKGRLEKDPREGTSEGTQ